MSRAPNRTAQLEIGASPSNILDLFVNRRADCDGVSIHIVSAADEKAVKRDAEKDAAQVYMALLSLPKETRAKLQLLIHENTDLFVGEGQSKNTRVHPWPPRSR